MKKHRLRGSTLWLPLSFIFVPLLFLYLSSPIQALVIKTDLHVVHVFPFEEKDDFSIRWVHSVEEEEWEEFYFIKNDHIFLSSTRFKTFGAGVPSNVGKDTFLKDGWVYMTGINREIGTSLFIRANTLTNHRFMLDGKTYLMPLEGKSTQFSLQLEDLTRFSYFLHKVMNRLK